MRAQPLAAAHIVGDLLPGTVVPQIGEFGQFMKISLGDGRFGFVDASNVKAASEPPRGSFEPLMTHSPPVLEVTPASLATRADKVKIQGVARDGDQVVDTYMFAGSRKVFYQSNRKGKDSKSMRFEQEVELDPGINVIVVVSRENEDVASAHTLVVRRDGPNGEALATPKRQTFGEDWVFTDSAP